VRKSISAIEKSANSLESGAEGSITATKRTEEFIWVLKTQSKDPKTGSQLNV
jgi:hypothetical protein